MTNEDNGAANSLRPERGVHFFVCTNRRGANNSAALPCCADRGGNELLAALQSEFARRRYPRGVKVSGSTCLTTCQHGPTIAVYPDGVWYVGVTPADVAALFDAHAPGGDGAPLAHLLPPPDVRVW